MLASWKTCTGRPLTMNCSASSSTSAHGTPALVLTCLPRVSVALGVPVPPHPAHARPPPRPQVESMVQQLTGGKPLPGEVSQQVVAKTDGVPLFVEELRQDAPGIGSAPGAGGRYVLTGPLPPLAIPATLQDSLMARLDRLSTAQNCGAARCRARPRVSLRAPAGGGAHGRADVPATGWRSSWTPSCSTSGGMPPQATLPLQACPHPGGRRISRCSRAPGSSITSALPRCLAAHFPEIVETQPELLAYHYTEAALAGRPFPTGSGPGSVPSSARPTWKRSSTSPRAWSCSPRSLRPRRGPSRSLTCRSPWGRR